MVNTYLGSDHHRLSSSKQKMEERASGLRSQSSNPRIFESCVSRLFRTSQKYIEFEHRDFNFSHDYGNAVVLPQAPQIINQHNTPCCCHHHLPHIASRPFQFSDPNSASRRRQKAKIRRGKASSASSRPSWMKKS